MKTKLNHLSPAVLIVLAGMALPVLAQTKAQPVPTPGVRPEPGKAPAAAAPAATSTPVVPEGPDDPDSDMVRIPAFADPVQLSSLISLAAKTLKVQIVVQGADVPGTVIFNSPFPIKKSEFISLLDRLLEQQNYTITKDEFGMYSVHPLTSITSQLVDDQATTKVIRTPNVRPSSLKIALESQMGANQSGRQYAYIDDLGIIMITDSPRRVAAVTKIVERLLEEAKQSTFTRMELHYVAASVARARALELVGSTAPRSGGGAATEGQAGNQPAAPRPGALDNLSDRLMIDSQGNALIFRGLVEEALVVQRVLSVIDVPNNLKPKSYFVGSQTSAIADLARLRGLGEVTTITDTGVSNGFGANNNAGNGFQRGNGGNQSNAQAYSGGPMMIVDEARGTIIYYATEGQQSQLEALIKEIDPQSEKVIIGVYKLTNSTAEDVAEIVMALIQNQTPLGNNSDLLNTGGSNRRGTGTRNMPANNAGTQANRNRTGTQPAATGELSLDSGGFVVADKANNQILVKAPAGQQREFARLIKSLDLRRAQVYLEAKIVTVTWSDDMRTAFETQLINANGTGGALNTSFGLSSFATTAGFASAKTVSTGLSGLTGAIIKSDQVPIIINALQTKTDARILSAPQLLVDDNEEAEIISVDSQPTTTTTQSNPANPLQTGFGGYEDAGTTLTVTPHISEGGYMGLKYAVELSSFTGTSANGLPAPKVKHNLRSDSVTIPSDTTVIVGGLNFDSKNLTRAQIPLLGDIPLLGLLFQDRHNVDRKTTLYIFLTPHILRDPTFEDLKLLTSGPQKEAGIGGGMPGLTTASIDILSNTLPPRMPVSIDQAPAGSPAPAAAIPLPAAPDEPIREDKSRGQGAPAAPVPATTPAPETPKAPR